MDERFQEVCCTIRACLNSNKGQCSLAGLSHDYKLVVGESIPYHGLGFQSLEALVRAVPNLKVIRNGNEIFVDVKPDEKTMHITQLVRGQRNAKKKSRKRSSYGRIYRSQAPPPRRPFGDASQRRKPSSPPPRNGRNYYSSNNNDNFPSRRRDPPPYQRRSSPPRYQRKPSPPPAIVISSEEEDYHDSVRRKYQSTRPSQYDFSDPNEFDEEGSDFEDVMEINKKMEALQVTLGKEQRQVSVNNKQKMRGYQSTSYEDDIGYSSMNEINATNNDSTRGDSPSYEKGDMSTKRSMARGPAAFLAAGRAMQEPNITHTSTQQSVQLREHINRSHPNGEISRDRQAFKRIDKPSSSTRLTATTVPPSLSFDSKSLFVNCKMNDVNMFKPGPAEQPNMSEDTFCGKLYAFTVRHNLQTPVFKTFTKFCPKTKVTSYMCKVKIGSALSFSSCPYESTLIHQVQEFTARGAYEELQRRHENLDSKDLGVTTEENSIIKRVADIVNPHSSGLKCDEIEKKYKILYQQILPLNWIDIIKNRSLLSVEELWGGRIAVYPIEGINVHSEVSKLPPLVLPENEVWNVYVTCCTSTACLYFRIVHDDFNGRYATMDETMTDLYTLKKDELKPVDIVKEGSYYAAYLDKSWFRVKALSGIMDECVRVSLIDHGDVDEVRKHHLFPLDERFTNIPAQKVSCNLTGLEEYSKESYVTKIVYDLTCGKVFVAKVDSRNPHLQLTLLDTSTDVDINVNDLILDRIDKELSPPKIPSRNNVTDAYLVSIKEDGLAFVQIISESFKLLKSFLAEASQELAVDQKKYCVKSTSELAGNRIFLAKYAVDGQWYRVSITNVESEKKIEVFFVDYGNVECVELSDIADITHFTDALAIMPNQAIQVRLVKATDELFTENVLQFLMDLSLSKDNTDATRYLLKTVKEGVIADVELFVRLPNTNELVNLNDIIASYFREYRGPNHVAVKLSSAKSNLIKPSKMFDRRTVKQTDTMERVFPIPTFQIPEGEPFNVYVTMVSSPFNFVVQPHEYRTKLSDLMSAMKDFYEIEQPIVDVSNIQEEEAYAVKTDSGVWCRGVVVKVLSGLDCISVKLIDYGEIVSIKYADLAHLLPCFRELPRQAVKAELAGIVPLHRDWSVEDSLRFKNLVSQKVLISVVAFVHKDGKISIILYDTSTDEQVDIGLVLVEEGRAKDVTK